MKKAILLASISSALTRAFLQMRLGSWSNDDLRYIALMMSGEPSLFPEFFNVTELHFPPGYPWFLASISHLGISSGAIKNIEVICFPLLTSLIFLVIADSLSTRKSSGLRLALMISPAIVLSPVAASYASEYVFTLAASVTLLAFIMHAKSGKDPYLVFSGITAGFAYLVRPEGILLFTIYAPLLATLLWRWNIRKMLTSLCSILIGLLALVVPYLIYLHHNLGRFTFSGKDSAAESVISSLYGEASGLRLYLHKLYTIAKLIAAPNLFGQTFFVLVAIVVALSIQKRIDPGLCFASLRKNSFLLVPVMFVLLSYVFLNPLSRSFYSFGPFLLLAGIIAIEEGAHADSFIYSSRFTPRFLILLWGMLLSISLASNVTEKTTRPYINTSIKLNRYKERILFTRSSAVIAMNYPRIGLCGGTVTECMKRGSLILASDLIHPSVDSPSEEELEIVDHIFSGGTYANCNLVEKTVDEQKSRTLLLECEAH